MSSYKANPKDQKRAESIRRQYLSREDNKLEQLQKLDSKVKTPGKIAASLFGAARFLCLQTAMGILAGSLTTQPFWLEKQIPSQ